MKEVLYLSIVTAAISFTVAETRLFKPVREWLQRKNTFIGGLFSCGYCFGFWIALSLTVICRPSLFGFWKLADYFFTMLVIAWLAALQWILMCWLKN